MRVKLIKTPRAPIDGVPVDKFEVGKAYDLPSSLANCLIADGLAEPEGRREVRKPRSDFATRIAEAFDRARKSKEGEPDGSANKG